MIYAPIWKDTIYTTTVNSLEYSIKLDGNTIYEGLAKKMPNANSIAININKICKDYLRQDIYSLVTTTASSQSNSEACLDFTLCNSTGGTIETYRFLYDWDHSHSWTTGSSVTLSNPVNGEYAPSMYKLKTTVSSTGAVNTYRNTGSYDKQVCADYALYYVNLRGGWDAFAFTGRCRKTDNITQYTTNKTFNNTTPEFEDERYASVIRSKYELNTGFLTDAQSENFARNLASSNRCYLHNLQTDTVIPVVIEDTSVEYKKQDDGGEMVTYKVSVIDSQSRLRQ